MQSFSDSNDAVLSPNLRPRVANHLGAAGNSEVLLGIYGSTWILVEGGMVFPNIARVC